MKKTAILIIGVLLFSGWSVKAQSLESKYGIDSLKTLEQNSIYVEYYKQKNFMEALPAWRYVFLNAPRYHVNTYKRGEEIISHMLEKTESRAYFDTLMMLYDQRMKYFNDEAYVLGRKGVAQFLYGKQNKAMDIVKSGYTNMVKSYELSGERTGPQILDVGLQAACFLANNAELTSEEFLNLYMQFSDFTDQRIKNMQGEGEAEKMLKGFEACKGNLDAIFINSGLADCDALVSVFTEKYNENKEDLPTLKMIIGMLTRQECEDASLYTEVVEQMYRMEPNANAAGSLGRMFFKKEDYAKAEHYFKEAIDKSEDSEEKEGFYGFLANISLIVKKNYPQAKNFALEMLKLNPRSGDAHMIIGKAYAYGADAYAQTVDASRKDFEKKAVYWTAVDRFNRAKQADPEKIEEANKWIGTYAPHFPTVEEAFFLNVLEGNDYKIGGWINETTKVRLVRPE